MKIKALIPWVPLVLPLVFLSTAFPAPLQITGGSASIVDANGEQISIYGSNFNFNQPGTVDADFLVYGATPGTMFNLSGELGFVMDTSYFGYCGSAYQFSASTGTYNGITADCITGPLDYSASLLVSADGTSATGTFTATGEVQGWQVGAGGPAAGDLTQLWDVQLAGSGTAYLSGCDGCNHFDALSLSFSDPPDPPSSAPEPAALLLIPTGLAALVFIKRRRHGPISSP